jgi:peptide/nickel transport system substrate-binding protein
MMQRRTLILSSAAALAAPSIARGAARSVLKVVPQSNLTAFDPVWTTALVTRNHGYMVYDTLYGMDSDLKAQPQMAAGHSVEDDGKRVTITLRPGLKFHDNTQVLARDCVASIRRWMARNSYGQVLAVRTDALSALDDTRIEFRLNKPFPLLFAALASIGTACVIMPERLALTDPYKQVTDTTGSGPFRFLPGEFNSGSQMVYARHDGYVPRDEKVSFTAGGKRALMERIEWRIIPDAATASAALQNGEIDWFEQPPPEIQALLSRHRDLVVENITPRPSTSTMRFNHLHGPFNTKAARQALLPAIVQPDFVAAIQGDAPGSFVPLGVFTPGMPMASTAGMEALTGPRSLDRAKAMLKDCGALETRMRLIGPTDILAPAALTQVAAGLFQQLGMNMDLALSDWGTVIQRRNSHEPVEKGGWSVFTTSFDAYDWMDPGTHAPLRANGEAGWFGWPSVPRIEALRDQWFDAPNLAEQQRVAADIQRAVFDEVPFIPLGGFYRPTAIRRDLKGRVPEFMIFYNLERA